MIEELINYLNFTNLYWQVATPLIFMLADILSGFAQAIVNRDVDSQKMRIGILHKLLLILSMLLTFILDFAFAIDFISKIYCTYLVIMEIISISENMTKAGIDLGKIKSILKIKWEGSEKNGKTN